MGDRRRLAIGVRVRVQGLVECCAPQCSIWLECTLEYDGSTAPVIVDPGPAQRDGVGGYPVCPKHVNTPIHPKKRTIHHTHEQDVV